MTRIERARTVSNLLREHFHSNNIEYFIGGSTRFGWSSEESDIDFFVHPKGLHEVKSIENVVEAFGGIKVRFGYVKGTKQYLICSCVHLTLIITELEYVGLSKLHDRVYDLLQREPITLTFAKWCKQNGISGSFIFKMLVAGLKT
jgi:hypothetical protein